MRCHFLLQGIFLNQESNPDLLPCRQIVYQLSYKGSPSWGLAEDGFDPSTSGLWAQHASTAPCCSTSHSRRILIPSSRNVPSLKNSSRNLYVHFPWIQSTNTFWAPPEYQVLGIQWQHHKPGVLTSRCYRFGQFSRSVESDSLRPHGLQHARPPCPSPTPGAWSKSCPSSWWCYPTISSSVIPFSSCLQSFPASGSFPMSQFFASGGQSIGVSASASVLPMNIQNWFPLGWTGWTSLQSKGLSSLLQHHSSKASILRHSAFFMIQHSHPYMTPGKTIALTRQAFVGKVMSLLFNMLSWSLFFFQGATVF